jgi:Holliday junction DNA helicase RuvA
MIASLTGIVTEHADKMIILDVHGVGYGVLVTTTDQGVLSAGKEAKLYIYENIKEDTYDLIGFRLKTTKHLFEQLLQVKNVGPKVALSILDIGSDERVKESIANGDVKFLQTAKGVGRRAAEQVVVELRDKVGVSVGAAADNIVHRGGIETQDEAIQALVALGYSDADAHAALTGIPKDLPLEERIRQALKK